MVYVMLADGFEEIEAFLPIDLMRRAGVEVLTVSLTDTTTVRGSHNIVTEADVTIDKLKVTELPKLIMLPGGMPGAQNLANSSALAALLCTCCEAGGLIAAICAAPFVLGRLGLLEGKQATCYPGYEEHLLGAKMTNKRIVRDGNIITAMGMGVSTEFGLLLVQLLTNLETAEHIRESIYFQSGLKKNQM